MPQILIVEKEGCIKTKKTITNTIDELYKICGFRKNENFIKINTFDKIINNETVTIELWGRKVGKNNIINNYKFMESLDNSVIYGNCCLIRILDNVIIDLEESMWNKFNNISILENMDKSNGINNGISNGISNVNIHSTNMDVIDKGNKSDESNESDESDESDENEKKMEQDDEGSELKEESYIYSSEDEET